MMLRRWYQSLVDREKILLLVGSSLSLLLLLWLLLWQPLLSSNHQLQQSIEQKQQQLSWMQQTSTQILELRKTALPGAGGSIQQRLTRTASKLRIVLTRMQNSNDQKLKVWIDKSEFNQLLKLIDELSKQGVAVDQLHIQPLPESGFSKARLTLVSS